MVAAGKRVQCGSANDGGNGNATVQSEAAVLRSELAAVHAQLAAAHTDLAACHDGGGAGAKCTYQACLAACKDHRGKWDFTCEHTIASAECNA